MELYAKLELMEEDESTELLGFDVLDEYQLLKDSSGRLYVLNNSDEEIELNTLIDTGCEISIKQIY